MRKNRVFGLLFMQFFVVSINVFGQLAPNQVKKKLLDSDDPSCCICLEGLTQDSEMAISECGHGFCRPCIATWMARKPDRVNVCPMCRQVLEPYIEKNHRLTSFGCLNFMVLAVWRVLGSARFNTQTISQERGGVLEGLNSAPLAFDYVISSQQIKQDQEPDNMSIFDHVVSGFLHLVP